MFENVPAVTVSDWFASAEITPRMLRTLNNIGPGGVIIADLDRRDYYATHSRSLDPGSQMHFIVYGYHDLVIDLDVYTCQYGGRAWEELVPAVDCTAWECMDERAENITGTGFVATRMRQHMQRHGFDLTSTPHFYYRYASPGDYAGPMRAMVRDRYADRTNPAITVTVKSPVDEKSGGLSLITISDGDRHVTGWPARMRNQFIAAVNARRAREAVEADLRRTRT
ncbi:hypothetical protein Q8791_17025 [Nocardiopsis sp. CT-R113]|uniref:Uncharacterized protein n=1 Tax=Nocardiopsis codii TaxID=3065942 RepID=A0ABU7K9K4_9ACTN|nr:hypothetical protein [Nocardiopsis sp. CT-R113]MEE2038923.1 hypothetical protein [Nocardiopsis sp. CT-R113]